MKKQQSSDSGIGQFMDLKSDYAFKKIFGIETHKELLINFLNALLDGRKVIKDLVENPQDFSDPVHENRKATFGLMCTDIEGETFYIEMQRTEQVNTTNKALFYCATLLKNQAPKDDRFADVEPKEVYYIGLMDFKFENSRPGKYIHYSVLADRSTQIVFSNLIQFIFLELPNFNLKEVEIKTDLQRWFYILCHLGQLTKIPAFLNKGIFRQLFKAAELSNLNKEEYTLYEKELNDN